MKGYLKNFLPRLQEFSDTLDRKEILIDQPWVLVDESLNKIQYIFRREGSLIMSHNGNVSTGQWEYIPAARSLLIDIDGKKHLLNHGFVDKGLLILKRDGFYDDPWTLLNERIIPDLDWERYLKTLLTEKFKIRHVLLEDGSKIEFADPYLAGLTEGAKVFINGLEAADGNYKAKSYTNYHFQVRGGKVHLIFSIIQFSSDKGHLVAHKSVFHGIDNCEVYLNGNLAPDGVYKLSNNSEKIKRIVISKGKILQASRVLNWYFLIPVIVIILTIIAAMVVGFLKE